MAFVESTDDGEEHRANEVGLLLVITCLGVALVAAYNLLFARPTQPPPTAELQGCFTSDRAPPMLFDGKRLHATGSLIAPAPYAFQLSKYGLLSVTTGAPLRLVPSSDGRYSFELRDNGLINFIDLMHTVNGKEYGVFAVKDLEYLQVEVADGSAVTYRRATPEQCG